MQKYIVIADDLTGSNATCSLLKKIGLRAASILKLQNGMKYDTDVISYSTGSRGLNKEEAYKRVSEAIKILKDKNVLVYNKRIDSTLRGNIGAEINAMLDNLENDRIAVVVPAYPDSKRIVVNKTMLVNGVLLENSDAGKDPKTPIKTSCVETLIQKDCKYSSTYFDLADIEQPIEKLIKKIQKSTEKSRVLIFDTVNNEDIIKISRAIIQSNINIITVDPGPFTLYFSKELQKKKHLEKKILAVQTFEKQHLADLFYAYGDDNSLGQTAFELLKKAGKTVTAAESLTAGLFQATLANFSGASKVFGGGFVTYGIEEKSQMLGIPLADLEMHGVVSAYTAEKMATQARKLTASDYAVSLTGVAGPDSLEGHPAGTVYIGLATADNVQSIQVNIAGRSRTDVRKIAVLHAFNLLRKTLLKNENML